MDRGKLDDGVEPNDGVELNGGGEPDDAGAANWRAAEGGGVLRVRGSLPAAGQDHSQRFEADRMPAAAAAAEPCQSSSFSSSGKYLSVVEFVPLLFSLLL